jgi:tRNA(fMet)-specific endonuclease VapC
MTIADTDVLIDYLADRGEVEMVERSGNPIGMADSLIAGIVTSNGAPLLTRNRRHFERVPGLKLA